MILCATTVERLRRAVRRSRLIETAVRLIEIPSRTGEAGAAADCLAELLQRDGFTVERPAAGHPAAPAVVVRLNSGKPGRTLQFNGHLDVVHLPFVPPRIEEDRLTGSGASDMKGGIAAAVEALRVLRDTETLSGGSILLTAHDLHEAPWGRGEQLDQLIREGVIGDAVLLPEPLCDRLPLLGRGLATWKVTLRRPGPPVHETLRPLDEPDVLAAGAELLKRFLCLNQELSNYADPQVGSPSIFVGQFHGGEIYNQFPQACWLQGTRRWLPSGTGREAEVDLRRRVENLAQDTGTFAELEWCLVREGFCLRQDDPVVHAFNEAYQTVTSQLLPPGPKPFVDDGNSFWGLARVPAITHGPRAGGQHTVQEWVSLDDLVRVAQVYALTAVAYCGMPSS